MLIQDFFLMLWAILLLLIKNFHFWIFLIYMMLWVKILERLIFVIFIIVIVHFNTIILILLSHHFFSKVNCIFQLPNQVWVFFFYFSPYNLIYINLLFNFCYFAVLDELFFRFIFPNSFNFVSIRLVSSVIDRLVKLQTFLIVFMILKICKRTRVCICIVV